MYKNKFLSLLLVFSLVICGTMGTGKGAKAEETVTTEESGKVPQVESGPAEEEFEDDLAGEDEDIDVTMRITAEWEHHYNAEVEITNLSEDKIDDWEISFDFENKIENIWNAQIMDYDEELQLYTIKNVVWNQDIKPGEKVCFGMTVSYAEKKDTPSDWYLTKACMEVQDEYDVDLKEYNRFDGNKINGQITITNRSGHTIEDWKLDFSSNLYFDENQVWGAELLDGDYASFDNKDAIKNIEPGQSVSFTFIATCDDDNVDIFEYTLYEMIEIPEELEGDDEWEDEYKEDVLAQYYFERSDFVSDEAYEEYLIRHEAWKNTKTYISLNKMNKRQKNAVLQAIATAQPTATPQIVYPDNPKKVNKPITMTMENVKYTFINAGGDAVQAYCKRGKYWYFAQRVMNTNKVVITKTIEKKAPADNQQFLDQWKLKAGEAYFDLNNNKNTVMILEGYNHGQSLEIFCYNKEVYLLVTAGSVGKGRKFGNEIAIIKFVNGRCWKYGKKEDDNVLETKYLTNLGYANKKQKKIRSVRQVETALSENKKTLLVWSELNRYESKDRKVQISCYNLKSLMKQLLCVKKKKNKKITSKKVITCRRSFKTLNKKSCYCSVLQKDTKKNVVKAYNSIQSIDLSNKTKEGYKIFVCGGNMGNKDAYMPTYIATMKIKGSKSTYLTRTNILMDTTVYGTNQIEMEGMHYENKKLDLVIVPTTGRNRQVMCSISESSLN